MRLFVRVVEAGSFSRAAKAAGVAQPTVSKQIAALEEHLKTQLLRRTPRGLSVTETGKAYYAFVAGMLADLDTAEARIGQDDGGLHGRVRISFPPLFASRHVIPRLPDFLDRNPELSLQIDVSERYVSLIEDGVDLAVRIGDVDESSLSARQIGSVAAMIVAAPAYLQRHGVPATPEALQDHSAVQFLFHGEVRPWAFVGGGERIQVSPSARIQTNDADSVQSAAMAGLGIARGPSWMFVEQLAAGWLTPILQEYAPPTYPIWAVTTRSRHKAGPVEAIADFLAELFEREPELRIR
ncbi:LysR family transcriptional regulator [Caulobacter sp. S45]|uniref:LysR family transcriptional regulator n=1 Tax=Caulobacter sp. S45 TaxID=1641861 RepID=UPI00131CB585|nr:LysR family transcriptional regulator [Caulobacter sp. S45]